MDKITGCEKVRVVMLLCAIRVDFCRRLLLLMVKPATDRESPLRESQSHKALEQAILALFGLQQARALRPLKIVGSMRALRSAGPTAISAKMAGLLDSIPIIRSLDNRALFIRRSRQ
jgi:hypothetical protein